jgi:hypothetical protein
VVVARVSVGQTRVVAVLVDVVSAAAYREWHWYCWQLGDPSTVDHRVVNGGLVVSWAAPGSLGPVASVGSRWLAADETELHATHASHVVC